MTTRPVVLPAGRYVTIGVALGALAAAAWMVTAPSSAALFALAVLSAVLGVLFVLPVGGADVPIVISLLNAFTGLAVAASGFVLDNVLLIIAGTLVGASGTLLTRMMAQAMGRPLTNTLFGAFTARALTAGAGERGGPPGPLLLARRRRDHARVRAQGDPRARLRPGRRAGPAHPARARRHPHRAGHRGHVRDPSGGRAHARAHERPAG